MIIKREELFFERKWERETTDLQISFPVPNTLTLKRKEVNCLQK